MNGKKRCELHGGKSTNTAPKGNKFALKHGLYSKMLSEEDKEVYFQAELGTVDEEIRMAKVQLAKAYRAQFQFGKALEDGRVDAVVSRNSQSK